ncbi:collagenase-like protein with putative collagen-binding domain [Isoptericola jiangsuensis]|uniref:Collagenase-like protein with putative collagen-binding domain n=1 Tax=Isoptericola jiangsuensis TaxID=548579 RepID=A0A2A9F171_9MICO|nr:collagenase-like protein with putative collagen-binding domain [Isoptericola jiangsuensis]
MLALLVLAGGAAAVWWWDRTHQGQAMPIPGDLADGEGTGVSSPPPASSSPRTVVPGDARFVAEVSDDGRYFVDQLGDPVLVRGDSPWSLLVDTTPEQATTFLENRRQAGVDALIVSLLGATGNGGPADDGSTVDGLRPFVDGDVLTWEPDYWDRAHDVLAAAAERGITVFLYAVDGWTIDRSFVPGSVAECRAYGEQVGSWSADLPNIVWMTGGDYFPATDDLAAGSDVDRCFAAVADGVRATGGDRPFSIQLGYPVSASRDNPFWAPRVDFDFVYTYAPTFAAVRAAYDRTPAMPALFAEGNYERENNDGASPPTTNETLRRQAAWALTSGSPGDFYGSDDWEFLDGWEARLDSPGLDQVGVVRDTVASTPWWRLRPDLGDRLVVSGRGSGTAPDDADVLDADLVTAAVTDDGGHAVVYVPTEREIGLDLSVLAPGATATWVDPSDGTEVAAELADRLRTPGVNADGGGDWLLVVGPGT